LTYDDSQVPPALFADPDMIAQVMNNLISNSLRYAKGKINIVVEEVKGDDDDSWMQFSVEDDGPGIPKDQHENLFSKFMQFNRPQGGAGYKGTGLGLAICKAIIDQHRGKIWVESKEGKGSKFVFKLTHYDEGKIFTRTMDEAFQDVEIMGSSLSVIVIFVDNIVKLHEMFYSAEVEKMFEQIEGKLKNIVLRQSDKISFYIKRGLIVIQAVTDRKAGLLIKDSIPELTEGILCEGAKGRLKPQLSVGMAMYPDDAKDPKAILNKAFRIGQTKRVMLIDEQQSLLHITAFLLKEKDFLIEMAIDGQSGIDLAKNFKPDVILMDVVLSDMDGWEVCKTLKEMPNTMDTPIIVITSSHDEALEKNLKKFDVAYLSKPYDQQILIEMIREESLKKELEFEF